MPCRSYSKSPSIQDDLVDSVSNKELDVHILVSNSDEKFTNKDHGEAFAHLFQGLMRGRMIEFQM